VSETSIAARSLSLSLRREMGSGGQQRLPAPGKRELLARGVALAQLPDGARVVDLGCGGGTSVEYLRHALGLRTVGLDLSAPGDAQGGPFLQADARALPLADGAVDGVLLECVLSVVRERERVLGECVRVLKPGGKLILTDLYAREPRPAAVGRAMPGPCGAEFLPAEKLLALVDSSGLVTLAWEDHTRVLKEYVARLILQEALTVEALAPRPDGERASAGDPSLRPGYGLLVAENPGL